MKRVALQLILNFQEIDRQENDPSSVHLAKELKEGTQEAHRQAESVQFVRLFLRGKVPKDIYSTFVGCLYFIYQVCHPKKGRKEVERGWREG
jgi:hypothetical protein